MLKNFNGNRTLSLKDPRSILRIVAGTLLVLNVVAGYFVLRPLGGSSEELEQEAANLRSQLVQQRTVLQRTKLNVSKVEGGRSQGDQFMEAYFLTRRTAASTILGELAAAAKASKIRGKVNSFNEQPIEGSDNLSMMVITGEAEGTYADLIGFVNRIDRSPRLIIMESLSATPQQGSAGILNIGFKLDAFVREDNGMPVMTKEPPAEEQSAPAPIAQTPADKPPSNPAPEVPAPANQPHVAAPPQPAMSAAPVPVQPSDAERPSRRSFARRGRPSPSAEEQQQ